MNKVKVGIIGTGNIGTDLLYKIRRSNILECALFAGRNGDSGGIRRAKEIGVQTSTESIQAFVKNPDLCKIVFDTTSAGSHIEHASVLKKLGIFVVDLTPSKIGTMCVPSINLNEAIESDNVNLITCGGQTLIPIARAVMQAHPETKYIEIVGSIASKSAGEGTRKNIEEYIQTTSFAIEKFSGVPNAKAILILNPAEPPILMHNTLYAQIEKPNLSLLREKITAIAAEIKKYVPGYNVVLGPVVEKGSVIVMVEVTGQGDFLPEYAGNLDIITCAAMRVAEEFAVKKILKKTV